MAIRETVISKGATQLSAELSCKLQGLTFTLSGVYVSTDGRVFNISEQSFTLQEGINRLELGINQLTDKSEVRLLQPSLDPEPGWTTVQILAGLGSGILVQDGVVVGDAWVLKVTD